MADLSPSIMLVDDDRFLLDIYATRFKEAGFSPSIAVGAAEALKRLRGGEKPQAMIIDVLMPAVNGLELVEMLRKEKLAVGAVMVMLTNETDPAKKAKAQELGVKAYIIKASTPPADVVKQVKDLIGAAN